MDAARIEKAIDIAGAAIFASAAGFAAWKLASPAPLWAVPVAPAAFLITRIILARITPSAPEFALPAFELAELGPFRAMAADELVLTDDDRLESGVSDPMVLDDVLEEIGPQSRVVRLFDRTAMPTPDQQQRRIDPRFQDAHRPLVDASEALYSALDQLRRTLR